MTGSKSMGIPPENAAEIVEWLQRDCDQTSEDPEASPFYVCTRESLGKFFPDERFEMEYKQNGEDSNGETCEFILVKKRGKPLFELGYRHEDSYSSCSMRDDINDPWPSEFGNLFIRTYEYLRESMGINSAA